MGESAAREPAALVFFMNDLMNIIREAIEKDRLEEAEKEWYDSK